VKFRVEVALGLGTSDDGRLDLAYGVPPAFDCELQPLRRSLIPYYVPNCLGGHDAWPFDQLVFSGTGGSSLASLRTDLGGSRPYLSLDGSGTPQATARLAE